MSEDRISARVRRVVHASIESAVLAAENVSGTAMLREAVRELERAEEGLRRDRERLLVKRDGAAADQKARRNKAGEMADNARYALGKGREDLATQAVAQQMDLEAEADRLAAVQAECKVELAAIEEALAELSARREKMRKDVSAAAAAQADGSLRPSAKPSAQAKVDAAIARANTIFEQATGSRADPLQDPATARGMAEIDAMKREDAIADRLEALKAKAAKPAAANRKGAKRQAG